MKLNLNGRHVVDVRDKTLMTIKLWQVDPVGIVELHIDGALLGNNLKVAEVSARLTELARSEAERASQWLRPGGQDGQTWSATTIRSERS